MILDSSHNFGLDGDIDDIQENFHDFEVNDRDEKSDQFYDHF